MVKYHSLGTAATVKQISKLSLPHVEFRLFLIGYCRIRIQGLVRESPFPVAMVTEVDYVDNAGETCAESGSERCDGCEDGSYMATYRIVCNAEVLL
jgi:hypothetical protein